MATIYADENYPQYNIQVNTGEVITNITDISQVHLIRIWNRGSWKGNEFNPEFGEVRTTSLLGGTTAEFSRMALLVRDMSITSFQGGDARLHRFNYSIDIGANVSTEGYINSTNNVSWLPSDFDYLAGGVVYDGLFNSSTLLRSLGAGLCFANQSTVRDDGLNEFIIETNLPVFTDYNHFIEYINSGNDIEYAVNIGGDEIPIDTTEPYYIVGDTWKVVNGERTQKIAERTTRWYRVPYGYSITGRVIEDAPYNIMLTTDADYIEYVISNTRPDATTTWTRSDSFPDNLLWTTKGRYVQDNYGNTYIGDYSTNIEIIGDISSGSGGSPSGGSEINPTGTKSHTQTAEESNIGNVFNTVFYGGESVIRQIANLLYSNDSDTISAILDGLVMFGNNPIEFVQNLYYTPIDVTDFCISASQSTLMFGSYQATLTNAINRVTSNGKIKTLFNETIYPIYNDFRQFQNVHYKLYLPYYGMVDLNSVIITGSKLKCDCVYDLRTMNLKYYLYSNGRLIGSYETVLGVNIGLLATDTVGKGQQSLRALESIATNTLGFAFNPVGAGVGVAGNIAESVISANVDPSVMSFGNNSSATACNDVSYPFLVIDEQLTIKPANLNNLYGYPCNRITTLGNTIGYIECADVRLTTSADDDLRNEVLTLLKGGVIMK